MQKFFERFFWIAAAVDPIGDHPDEMWDEAEGFFYDVLRMPDNSGSRLRVRSIVGLLPMCATTVIEPDVLERFPALSAGLQTFLRAQQRSDRPTIADPRRARRRRPAAAVARRRGQAAPDARAHARRGPLPVAARHPLAVAVAPSSHPYEFDVHGQTYRVAYEPAESTSGMFGGNSNWRGPVWFPINMLILRALLQHYQYYGDDVHDRMPHRIRPRDDAVRGRPGSRPPADRDVRPRRRRHAARCTAARTSSRTIPTGAT